MTDREPASGDVALACENASVWAWDARAGSERYLIHEITWTVAAGEQWAVLGKNGAGKTTLLNLAAARRHPSSGSVDVLGQRLGHVDLQTLRHNIGHIDPAIAARLSPRLTALEAVLTGVTGSIALLPDQVGDGDREHARRLLEQFGCGALLARPLGECSQGERQRVLLARALVRRPRLLLLDEPADGLDLGGREALLRALATITRDQPEMAVVTVTHHLEELPATTTHALLLRDGRVTATGAAAAVLADGPLSACFGLPVSVSRLAGRWVAHAG